MKTLAGKIALVAAALAVTSLPAFAQNVAGRPGTVDRSTERLSLLPGPDLLSPASGAPQSGPSVTITPAAQVPQVRFVPSYLNNGRWQFTPKGVLTLGSDANRQPSAPPPQSPPLGSELFRFDATLHPPSAPLRLEAVPAKPKRD